MTPLIFSCTSSTDAAQKWRLVGVAVVDVHELPATLGLDRIEAQRDNTARTGWTTTKETRLCKNTDEYTTPKHDFLMQKDILGAHLRLHVLAQRRTNDSSFDMMVCSLSTRTACSTRFLTFRKLKQSPSTRYPVMHISIH